MTGEAEDRTLHVWVRFQLQVIDGVVKAARFQVYRLSAYGGGGELASPSGSRVGP